MRADLRIVGPGATGADPSPVPAESPVVPRLLWGWPEVTKATGIPKRTLQKELSAGRFPKPTRPVGRRPYWDPRVITRWAEGSLDRKER
jgi:hypothetical protein